MIAAALFGGEGRMGAALRGEAADYGVRIAAVYDISPPGIPGGTSLPLDIDVVIDFSAASAFQDLDRLLAGRPAALVTGTTGLGPAEKRLLEKWSADRAVFHSPNMSLGVHLLSMLVCEAARLSAGRFDLEIVETHHRGKVDSPSGTALRLLEAWTAGSGSELLPVNGRAGRAGPRRPDEAGLHAVRGGDVAGDHEVHLLGDGERLCLSHRSSGRRTFAIGALRAAVFVAGRGPGLYGMDDLAGWMDTRDS